MPTAAAKKKAELAKKAAAKKKAELAKKAAKKKVELAKKAARKKLEEKRAIEAARKKAQREKEMERRRIAAEKKKAQLARQKELARIAAEKAKEKARIAAEKAAIREAKEKERIAIREAKEAARLAAAEAKKAEEARLEAIRKKNEPKPKATHEKTEFLDGIYATKDFDHKFLASQRELLLEMRAVRTTQAARLEDEANALIEDVEMGDVQFDEEGGEGDTMVVERERDLVLSAEARHEIQEIDAALERIRVGDYGYSIHSGLPIPRERLKAIPWTQESVQERVGGIGRR